jgi:O-antigen/teichoic acid export membrane protein
MSTVRQLAKSIAGNWIAFAISIGVAFFLSPFIVHHLGNIAYGVWTLVVSMISFMSLLDLGLRGAVTRFVARHHTQGDHLESSHAVSAAFWLRIWISLLVITVSAVIALLSTAIFHIPADLSYSTRCAIILMGTSLAITLSFGVFGGVLVALQRFALVSCVTVIQTLLRAGGAVWLLQSGHGILGLAIWEFTVTLLANASLAVLCFRVYPELRISLRRPDAAILRQFVNYSSYVFVIHCAQQLIYYTDNVVVGVFISAGAVTFYAIGGSLLDYLRQVVTSMTQVFMPLASSFEARGEQDQLRRLLIQGTRGSIVVASPIAVALFFRGHTFIQLWMGGQYEHISGRVLQILLLAQVFSIANFTAGNIAYGLSKHRAFALSVLAESVSNLALSIFLVKQIGITGVAWGTVIPSLVVQLLFWPRYICKILEIPLLHYFWQGWVRPGLALLPFGIACYLSDRFLAATNLFQFFLQIAAVLPIFLASIVLCFWKELAWQMRGRLGFLSKN